MNVAMYTLPHLEAQERIKKQLCQERDSLLCSFCSKEEFEPQIQKEEDLPGYR